MSIPFGPRLIGETEKTLNALLRQFLDDTGLTEPQWVTLQLAAELDGSVDAAGLAAATTDRAHFRDSHVIVALLTERALLESGRPSSAGLELIDRVRARVRAGTGEIWQGLPGDDVAGRVLNEVVRRARAVLAARKALPNIQSAPTDPTDRGPAKGVTMTDLQTIADRAEIQALQAEFTDATMMKDIDRVMALYTEDAVYAIPAVNIEFSGWEAIRAGNEQLDKGWEFFVQNTHPGAIQIDGDTATGRALIFELGRQRDGRSVLNYAIFHDAYRRTPAGWKFTKRIYEVRYFDAQPLTGSPEVDWDTDYQPSQSDRSA